MKPRPEIVLNIEHVLIQGLPSSLGLREGLEQELVRLLSASGALDSLLGIGEEALEIPVLQGGPLAAGPQLGHKLGQAVFQMIRGVAPSPPPSGPQAAAANAHVVEESP